MGDSDDEWNNNINNSSSNNMNSSSTNQAMNNTNYNNNKNKNRDKFYRERDDSSNSNNNNNNNYNNNNNTRRDWSADNRGRSTNNSSDAWKGRSMSSSMNNSPHMSSGYGGGGYQQRVSNSGGDYPRKYSGQHQTSPANFDSNSSPPYKRNKKDWDSNDSYSSSSNYHNNNSRHQKNSDYSKSQNETDYPTQPPCLSFKLFLQQQDDNISDEDAIKKYNEYKTEFKRTQINNFFLEHKEEDWFKLRYHPDENYKRRNEQNQHILNRLEVFMDLMQTNAAWFESASAEMDHSKELIRFLDAVVVKLEGGTDQDLKCLDGTSSETLASQPDVKEIKLVSKAD